MIGDNMGLLYDARQIKKRDPAARGILGVIFLYPGFHALIYHRIGHFFYRLKLYAVARWVSQTGRLFTGIEIHPGANIGKGLFLDHGMGIVIGETSVIGNNCTIYHGVTLGGTGNEKGKRHPTIGNNVLIGAGAKLLGPFTVGDNVMIGANAVVLTDIPDKATVVGIPGKVVRIDGMPISHAQELDHAVTADPVEQEICKLLHRVMSLEKAAGVNPEQRHLPTMCDPDKYDSDENCNKLS
jgi:serine O-acetyltransferase